MWARMTETDLELRWAPVLAIGWVPELELEWVPELAIVLEMKLV